MMFRILQMVVTHFIDLSARMYQLYSLKMTLSWLKHVGLTYSVTVEVLIIHECISHIYLI